MKVRILTSLANKDFHYGKGAVVEIPLAIAKSFIKGGLAEEVEVEEKPIPKIQRETSKTDIQTKNEPRKRANKSSRVKGNSKN